MKVISEYIIKKETNNNVEINFGILPMKYLDYREDLFASVIGFLGPFFIIIAYMGHLCIYSYKMVLICSESIILLHPRSKLFYYIYWQYEYI